VRDRFAALVILDGSRLAAIAHRLKLLWHERAVVQPGCVLGVYDLGRGLCRRLTLSADAAAGAMPRVKAVLADLARDTLVLGDRLDGTADLFAPLTPDAAGVSSGAVACSACTSSSACAAAASTARCSRTGWFARAPGCPPRGRRSATSAVGAGARATRSSPTSWGRPGQWEREIRARHPHLHLQVVAGRRGWGRARPPSSEVEPRSDHRRHRRFCPARRHWKSLTHALGVDGSQSDLGDEGVQRARAGPPAGRPAAERLTARASAERPAAPGRDSAA
jgi:hypothetical protein